QGSMRVLAIGVVCIATACSTTHSLRSASGTTTRNAPSTTSSTFPSCPGPPITLPSGGQTIAPVDVPCACPTEQITPISTADMRRTGVRAADAAFQWIQHVNPKWRAASASIQVLAVYAVEE